LPAQGASAFSWIKDLMEDITMDTSKLEGRLAATWSQFRELAERADAEQRRHGAPLAETSYSLDRLSQSLDKIESLMLRQRNEGELEPVEPAATFTMNGQEWTYAKGTAEQARFVKVLRDGMPSSEAAQARIVLAEPSAEQKAMALLDDTTGGYLAPAEFSNDILRAMISVSPVRSVATVVPTGGVSSLVPVRSGVTTARRVAETGTRIGSDLSFGMEQIPVHEAYALTVVSRALATDSRYPLDAELVDAASRSFALLEGTEFITGTGNGQMMGLDAATLPASNIVTCADSSGHLVAAADVQKLLGESLSAAYLPGARLLLNPKMLSTLRRLTATSGAIPMFPVVDYPGTLAGVPVSLMPDMPDNATPAAGRNVAYLIHPQAYRLVVHADITVVRLVEKYADTGQLGFYVFQRTGGQPVDPRGIARLVTA
jgi:HK97 family phage major capsid protein